MAFFPGDYKYMKVASKRLVVAGAVALGTALPFAGLAFAPQNTAQVSATPQMSEKYFKNVKVLTGIPVDEFMGTMGLFSAALSYCCGDCHTGAGTDDPKWEADPPRKIMARRMAAMVKAINKDNFGGGQAVTCWTCHRGSPEPAVTPSLDTIYGEPLAFPSDIVTAGKPGSGALPLDQIFDKYTQALGMPARLAAVTSYTAKGTSHLFGESKEDPTEIYAKAPNMLATFVHQREGDVARTYDGRAAWVMLPLTVVKEYPLTGSALEGGKLDGEMAFPWRIKQFFPNWRVGVPITLDGHDVNVVQGSAPGIIATFYFDKQTGLMTRMVRYANSAVGRVPTQIDYSDYRAVDGVMMPFKWIFGWVSGREEYSMTDYQLNAPVDASKFAQPVQRAK
jgi:photosynthetic reaction center cytochrome c subunit